MISLDPSAPLARLSICGDSKTCGQNPELDRGRLEEIWREENLHDVVRLTEPAYDPAKWNIVAQSDDPLWISKSSAPVAWGPVEFHVAWSSGFAKKHADVAAFLEKVDFKPDEISAMSYALQVDRQPAADYAKAWVEQNKGRIEEWGQ